MKKGAEVAAYVQLSEGFSWLLVKIEKRQANGRFVVHDVDSENPTIEHIIVESSNLTLFPNLSGPYEVGMHVLARWKNDDIWTTELYDAEVLKVTKSILTLRYEGDDEPRETSTRMVTTYPNSFLPQEEEHEEHVEIQEIKDEASHEEPHQ